MKCSECGRDIRNGETYWAENSISEKVYCSDCIFDVAVNLLNESDVYDICEIVGLFDHDLEEEDEEETDNDNVVIDGQIDIFDLLA